MIYVIFLFARQQWRKSWTAARFRQIAALRLNNLWTAVKRMYIYTGSGGMVK